MADTRFLSNPVSRPALRALAALLVFGTLWSQGLGLWHGVVHGGPAGQGRNGQILSESGIGPSAKTALARFFASHQDDSDCLFFDQLSHGDAVAPVPVLTLPLASIAQVLLISHGLFVARWHAQFQARGPPFSR